MTLRRTYRAHGVAACCLALSLLVACGDDDGAANNNNTNNQAQDCEASCPDVMAAGCANGPPSLSDCEQGCIATEVGCPMEFAALLQCTGDNPTYTCDTEDRPQAVGCETEQDALYECIFGIPSACETSCSDVMAAGCANGPPSVQECETGCADVLMQCPLAFDALMQCGGSSPTYSCGADDFVYMDSCVDEHEGVYACMAGVPESCVLSCPDVMTAGCDMSPPTLEDCYDGCGDTTVDCPTEYAALIQCGGSTPTYTCGPGGMVYVDGCETEHNDVYACTWETIPSCVVSCPLVLDASCNNGPPSLQECFTGCATAATDCPTEYAALTVCAGASPSYTCGTNGMVLTDGCVTEHEALYTCLGFN